MGSIKHSDIKFQFSHNAYTGHHWLQLQFHLGFRIWCILRFQEIADTSFKSFLLFGYSRQQSLYLIPCVLHFLLSSPYLHVVLWIPSATLSATFDNEPSQILCNEEIEIWKVWFFYFLLHFYLLFLLLLENKKVLYFSGFFS